MPTRTPVRDPRTLILSFGRIADGNAVSYVADRCDAELVLDLLDQPRNDRLCYAAQLGNFVREQERRPVWDRRCVPFRRGAGVFRLMPWRMAKWLAGALMANDQWRQRTLSQIRNWLGEPDEVRIAGAASQTDQ